MSAADVSTDVMTPEETSAPVVMAGSAHSVVVTLRDAASNPTPPVFRVGHAGLSVTLEGPSSVRDISPAPEDAGS